MSRKEKAELIAAVTPFLKIMAKLPARPRPSQPEYWHTPVFQLGGEALRIGHFARLAALLQPDPDPAAAAVPEPPL